MKKYHTPLNALRSFERVAYYLSVTKASDELHVSHAAVSKQVKMLERYLSVTLIRREGRRIALTPEGESYAKDLNLAFAQINKATENLFIFDDPNVLNISMSSVFSSYWLMPRLQTFLTANPDIELRISTSSQEVDFTSGKIDIALCIGESPHPDFLHSDLILEDDLYPVCSPKFFTATKIKNLKEEHLHKYKFIYIDILNHQNNWKEWLAIIGLPEPPKKSRIHIQDPHEAVQAAINGVGFILARSSVFDEEIRMGHLIVPWNTKIKAANNLYLICPKNNLQKNKVKKFRNWFLKELKNSS